MSANLDWNDGLAEEMRAKAMDALLKGGEKILAKANDSETPWATGTLGGSGDVQQIDDHTVQVSFSTPYARRQHEETMNHPDPRNPLSVAGRKDHYLRDPTYDLQDEIIQDVADAING